MVAARPFLPASITPGRQLDEIDPQETTWLTQVRCPMSGIGGLLRASFQVPKMAPPSNENRPACFVGFQVLHINIVTLIP